MQLLVQAKPAAQERPRFSEPSKLFLPLFFQKFKSLLLVQAPHGPNGPHGFPHHPSRHHGSYLVVHILHSSELVQFQAAGTFSTGIVHLQCQVESTVSAAKVKATKVHRNFMAQETSA